MRALVYGLLLALLLALLCATVAQGTGTHATRYTAHVRCDHVAEDTLSRVALTRYTVRANGTRVIGYRCLP